MDFGAETKGSFETCKKEGKKERKQATIQE
jgi:hypothetical protein